MRRETEGERGEAVDRAGHGEGRRDHLPRDEACPALCCLLSLRLLSVFSQGRDEVECPTVRNERQGGGEDERENGETDGEGHDEAYTSPRDRR